MDDDDGYSRGAVGDGDVAGCDVNYCDGLHSDSWPLQPNRKQMADGKGDGVGGGDDDDGADVGQPPLLAVGGAGYEDDSSKLNLLLGIFAGD